MTTTQQLHQEIDALPSDVQEEVLDFVLFVKHRTQRRDKGKTIKPAVKRALREAEREWEHGEVQVFDNPEEALKFLDTITVHS